MTPRIPSFDEPPPRLFDPEAGTVTLRLYPFQHERLHGPWPAELDEAMARVPGAEFPLRPDSQSFNVTLTRGLTPSDIGPQDLVAMSSAWADTSWWRWYAYAKTSLGWMGCVTPTFIRGRLFYLNLNPEVEPGPEEFERLERILSEELGPPHELRKSGFRPTWVGLSSFVHEDRLWTFSWGQVEFGYEAHHGELQVGVRWSAERL